MIVLSGNSSKSRKQMPMRGQNRAHPTKPTKKLPNRQNKVHRTLNNKSVLRMTGPRMQTHTSKIRSSPKGSILRKTFWECKRQPRLALQQAILTNSNLMMNLKWQAIETCLQVKKIDWGKSRKDLCKKWILLPWIRIHLLTICSKMVLGFSTIKKITRLLWTVWMDRELSVRLNRVTKPHRRWIEIWQILALQLLKILPQLDKVKEFLHQISLRIRCVKMTL